MSTVDPRTCVLTNATGATAPDASGLLAQYLCLYNSITQTYIPALTQIQGVIVSNNSKIQQYYNAEMMNFTADDGQQSQPSTGWPGYSIAFVCMCVAFLLVVIAAVAVAIKKLGTSAKVIIASVSIAILAIALFVVLIQRYL